MSRIIALFLLLLALTGCQTTKPVLPDYKKSAQITITSFPNGAFIEIDGDYMGRTPNVVALNEYHLEQRRDAPFYKVFIYPTDDEDYCMKKMALNPYDLPAEISFDLTQCDSKDNDLDATVGDQ